MLAQFVVRSSVGRILTHTPSMKHAFEYSVHWSRYMGAPCSVTNNANGQTVNIDNNGNVRTRRAHAGRN